MSITRVLPVVLLSLAVAVPAAARDCPPGYPPANTAIPKDGGGTRDVCDYDSVANRFTCTQTSGSFAQEMTAGARSSCGRRSTAARGTTC